MIYLIDVSHLIMAWFRCKKKQKAEKKEPAIVSKSTLTTKISVNDIEMQYRRVVAAFCGANMVHVNPLFSIEMSMDIQTLILFFYAKPLKMNIKKKDINNVATVFISPFLAEDWSYVRDQVLHCLADPQLSHYEEIQDHHFVMEHVSPAGSKQEVHFWNWHKFNWYGKEGHFQVKDTMSYEKAKLLWEPATADYDCI